MQDQPERGLAGLKVLVAGLGALIILGTAIVIGVIIKRLYAPTPTPSMAAVQAPLPVSGGVSLAQGEAIKAIAPLGGGLAVWVSGPGGERVLLVNPDGAQSTIVQTAR